MFTAAFVTKRVLKGLRVTGTPENLGVRATAGRGQEVVQLSVEGKQGSLTSEPARWKGAYVARKRRAAPGSWGPRARPVGTARGAQPACSSVPPMPCHLTVLLASPLGVLSQGSGFQTTDTSRGFAQQSRVLLVGHWMQTERTGPEAPGLVRQWSSAREGRLIGGCLCQASRCLEVCPLIPFLSYGLFFSPQFVFS